LKNIETFKSTEWAKLNGGSLHFYLQQTNSISYRTRLSKPPLLTARAA